MARVLIVLAVIVLLLNAMTFLVVVGQGGTTDKAAAQASTTAARPGGADPALQKIEQVLQSVQSLQKTFTELSRKVDGVERKLAQQQVARTIPAPQPAAAPTPTPAATQAAPGAGRSPGGLSKAIPAVRKGPTELSTVGTAPAQAQAGEEEEDDNAADHANQKTGAPARRTVNTTGESGADSGAASEAQPADAGGTGAPAETQAEGTAQE